MVGSMHHLGINPTLSEKKTRTFLLLRTCEGPVRVFYVNHWICRFPLWSSQIPFCPFPGVSLAMNGHVIGLCHLPTCQIGKAAGVSRASCMQFVVRVVANQFRDLSQNSVEIGRNLSYPHGHCHSQWMSVRTLAARGESEYICSRRTGALLSSDLGSRIHTAQLSLSDQNQPSWGLGASLKPGQSLKFAQKKIPHLNNVQNHGDIHKLYWLVHRDPYDGLLYSQYNKVVSTNPLYGWIQKPILLASG